MLKNISNSLCSLSCSIKKVWSFSLLAFGWSSQNDEFSLNTKITKIKRDLKRQCLLNDKDTVVTVLSLQRTFSEWWIGCKPSIFANKLEKKWCIQLLSSSTLNSWFLTPLWNADSCWRILRALLVLFLCIIVMYID